MRTKEFEDDRLFYYWDEQLITGKIWGNILEIESVAWDVYFVYSSEATWNNNPTFPDYYMHQLGGLPVNQRLDFDGLKDKVLEILNYEP